MAGKSNYEKFRGSKAQLAKYNKKRASQVGTEANKRAPTKQAGTPAKPAGGRAFNNDF